MPERPKSLFYTGRLNADGRPTEYFPGVPARDLTERDLARLDDARVAELVASSLYQKSKPATQGDEPKPAADAPVARSPAAEKKS